MSPDPILLGVNIDHVATLRQVRGTAYPDPVDAALLVERAGGDSITVHLREDRRHIQERDVRLLLEVVQTRVNLEMAATAQMVRLARRLCPPDCCLVPERRQELTTEGGLDVFGQRKVLRSVCARLADSGVRVSLFIDPETRQIDAAAECGVPVVELHTGRYARGRAGRRASELRRLMQAARHAHACGLKVNAGHGLNYFNVRDVAAIPEVCELNIGHAIVARAVLTGMSEAVTTMKRLMTASRQ